MSSPWYFSTLLIEEWKEIIPDWKLKVQTVVYGTESLVTAIMKLVPRTLKFIKLLL